MPLLGGWREDSQFPGQKLKSLKQCKRLNILVVLRFYVFRTMSDRFHVNIFVTASSVPAFEFTIMISNLLLTSTTMMKISGNTQYRNSLPSHHGLV